MLNSLTLQNNLKKRPKNLKFVSNKKRRQTLCLTPFILILLLHQLLKSTKTPIISFLKSIFISCSINKSKYN